MKICFHLRACASSREGWRKHFLHSSTSYIMAKYSCVHICIGVCMFPSKYVYRLVFSCCVLNSIGNDEDVELAVKSARTAFESWSTLPG